MRNRLQGDFHQTHQLCDRLKKSLKTEKDLQARLQTQVSALESDREKALDACEVSLKAKQLAEAALQQLKVAQKSAGKGR